MCFHREESTKRWDWSRVRGEQFHYGCAPWRALRLLPGTGRLQFTFLLLPSPCPRSFSSHTQDTRPLKVIHTPDKPEIMTPHHSV